MGKETFAPGTDTIALADVGMQDADGVDVEMRIRGMDRLVPHPIDLASFAAPAADLFTRASQSARKCVCEGRLGTSTVAVYRCPSCDHTSCESCRGRPVHQYVVDEQERLKPELFEADLKAMLPMHMSLEGFSFDQLTAQIGALGASGVKIRDSNEAFSSDKFCRAVADAVHESEVIFDRKRNVMVTDELAIQFHFQRITRRKDWTATFTTDRGTLELHLDGQGGEWRLHVAANPSVSTGNSLDTRVNA